MSESGIFSGSRAKRGFARLSLFLGAVFLLNAGFPADALAVVAIDFGDIVCNIKHNLSSFPPLISAIAYVVGIFMVVKGVMLLRKHAENTNDSKIVSAIAYLVVGACCLAFPSFAGILQETIFSSITGSSAEVCIAKHPDTLDGNSSLDKMMYNFVDNMYKPMFILLSALSFVMGAFLIAKGLMKASKTGTDPKAAAVSGLSSNFVVGAVLISIGAMADTMWQTLAGNAISSFPGINWSGITDEQGSTAAIDKVVVACLQFIQVVGFIAFIRGWLVVKNAVEGTGQATIAQGITHVIGGTMAINIGYMLKIFDNTFGSGLLK